MGSRTKQDVYLVNLDTLEKVSLMYIPREMEWNAESKWSVIATVGRNNPFYHFTGAEDDLEFELDWHALDEDRKLAIASATKIKSWSRNDGYLNRPPRIMFIFGELFRNHVFILQSAPYRMSLPQPQKGMLPAQIYQTIKLSKVTDYNEFDLDVSENNFGIDFL